MVRIRTQTKSKPKSPPPCKNCARKRRRCCGRRGK